MLVIATSDGLFANLFTRSPEGLNCRMCFQRSLASPWQFHSSLRRDGGNVRRLTSHSGERSLRIDANQSRFDLMNRTFQSGNSATSVRA